MSTSKIYVFDKTDDGYIGKAYEMAIKDALGRKNREYVSTAGRTDFVYNRHCYDTKQNGSCIKGYHDDKYIRGSSRVIYSTHVAYGVAFETAEQIGITVNLADTDMFVLDRNDFVAFLQSINAVKVNVSRGTANIQTCYNYKKNAYHGRKGYYIEEWARENELDDDIIGYILQGLDD